MKIIISTIISIASILAGASLAVAAECYGDYEYKICTETNIDSNGNIEIRSWDSEGNDYSVNTESYESNGDSVVRSYDSDGNEYSIKSWSDSRGIHSEDSDGNRCTVTYSGEMIGCN
jgi:uncharacterized protein YxeA